jgi:predicted aldo/keto reductase-like oxidoreductase
MINRREFIRAISSATAGVMVGGSALGEEVKPGAAASGSDRLGKLLPLRKLGSTGRNVTMLGVGGHHVGTQKEAGAQQAIEAALEGGVRFFDTAESYQKGVSEEYYGKFLTPKYRDVIYLMTKTMAKDARTASEHLDGSLKRLNTDYIDLWQIHDVRSADDVDNRLRNGVLDVMKEAQAKGKVRHLGFTGHTQYQSHLHMLSKVKDWQSCQFPVNVVDGSYKSFINNLLPALLERKIGVLAMKTAACGRFFSNKIVPDRISLAEMHYFVWSLPVGVLIAGFDTVDQLKERIGLARSFTGMTQEQRLELINKVADVAAGKIEYYKS